MRLRPFIALAACLLAAGPPAVSEEPPPPEASKAKFIREALRDRPAAKLLAFVTEDGNDLYRPPEWVAWCEQFQSDFVEQHGIEHVEPVAQSQRYDDPVFRPWQERCPLLAFNARGVRRAPELRPGPRGDWVRALPRHMPDGSWLLDYQYGTRDFKLFQQDFDSAPYDDGSEEVIFFADAYYSYWELIARDEQFPLSLPPPDRNWNDVVPPHTVPPDMFIDIAGEYRFLNLHKCLSKKLVDVSSPYYSRAKWPISSWHGIIRYRGRYYIFELQFSDNRLTDSYGLDLQVIRTQFEAMEYQPVDVESPSYCQFSGS